MNDQLTRPKAETRERIIESARQLFFEQGYSATGMAQILKHSRANSGSLYYFFPAKEDLLIAVLRKYKDLLEPAVLAPAYRRASGPRERLFAVLAGYRELLRATDFHLGCPIGNLALELSNHHPEVRKLVVENFEAWRGAVRSLIESAKWRLSPGIDSTALSHFVLVTMEGAVMLARAYHSFTPFDAAITSLHDYFDRLTPNSRRFS